MKKIAMVLILAAVVAVLPANAGAKQVIKAGAGGQNVYSPAKAHVSVGEKVVWRNVTSNTTHTVTGNNFSFNEKLQPGQSTSFKFNQSGTYKYHCKIHAGMVGKIVVG